MVLRRVPVEHTPDIAEWAGSPHRRQHPLGWLPLSLTALEGKPPLRHYTVDGSGFSRPEMGDSTAPELAEGTLAEARGQMPTDGPWTRSGSGDRVPVATETTTPSTASAMAAAVANWVEESNGRVEARVYGFGEDVDAVADTLLTLGLECLGRVDPRSRFEASSCSPVFAWQLLFAAASAGGAYSSGEYGAYGRLAAWRSVAALTGSAGGASAVEVERSAHQAAWYSFGSAVDWFEQVAWDVGLAVVAADRRRLAVLAATDTD
jgi:hypothetical protein